LCRTRLSLTSPLFPYTTLFRSERLLAVPGQQVGGPSGIEVHPVAERQEELSGGRRGHRLLAGQGAGSHQPPPWVPFASLEGDAGDRKSTRLNSSHQIISYAVFC